MPIVHTLVQFSASLIKYRTLIWWSQFEEIWFTDYLQDEEGHYFLQFLDVMSIVTYMHPASRFNSPFMTPSGAYSGEHGDGNGITAVVTIQFLLSDSWEMWLIFSVLERLMFFLLLLGYPVYLLNFQQLVDKSLFPQ